MYIFFFFSFCLFVLFILFILYFCIFVLFIYLFILYFCIFVLFVYFIYSVFLYICFIYLFYLFCIFVYLFYLFILFILYFCLFVLFFNFNFWCIFLVWQCDVIPGICLLACASNEFRCTNKKCISNLNHCDGTDNCGDGSDELNCRKCSYLLTKCQNNVLQWLFLLVSLVYVDLSRFANYSSTDAVGVNYQIQASPKLKPWGYNSNHFAT